MLDTDSLKQRFDGVAGVRFCPSSEVWPGSVEALPVMVVENRQARLVMALNGAHILSFVPAGQPDVFWLSPRSRLAEGHPIRGGIPLCLPWFGPHPDGFPQHGFARINNWSVEKVAAREDGATTVVMALADSADTRAMWPHSFVFRFEIVVGTTLRLRLSAETLGGSAARFEFAFHTYFNVGEVEKTTVEGLEDCPYVDREDGQKRKRQSGPVRIGGTIQNLYAGVPAVQLVKSPVGTYRIEGNARGAMVWNAGDNDRTIPDMGEGNHRGYLCVERLDAGDAAVTIGPGKPYETMMSLSREP